LRGILDYKMILSRQISSCLGDGLGLKADFYTECSVAMNLFVRGMSKSMLFGVLDRLGLESLTLPRQVSPLLGYVRHLTWAYIIYHYRKLHFAKSSVNDRSVNDTCCELVEH